MKRHKLWAGLSAVAALILSSQAVLAAVPDLMNIQTRLTDSAGVPINGAVGLVLRLYAADTGGAQPPMAEDWEETERRSLAVSARSCGIYLRW